MCGPSGNEDVVKKLTAAMSDPVSVETVVLLVLQGAGMETTVSIVEIDVVALGKACSKSNT